MVVRTGAKQVRVTTPPKTTVSPPKAKTTDAKQTAGWQATGKRSTTPAAFSTPRELQALPEPLRQQAEAVLRQANGDEGVAERLVDLTQQPLPEQVKGPLLETYAASLGDPVSNGVLLRTVDAPGFAALSPADQLKLMTYVGGQSPVSRFGRLGMVSLLNQPTFKSADAAGQADQLRKYLADQPTAPGNVSSMLTLAARHDVKAAPTYSISGPTPGDGVERYEVQTKGARIPVEIDTHVAAGLSLHSIDQVARGLAALPEANQRLIRLVHVKGDPNPNDAFFAKSYGDPNFRSYMTAGEDGVVSIYPNTYRAEQTTVDATLIHETGHTLSFRQWGRVEDARWDRWKAAIQNDGIYPSAYGRASPDEDLAEALVLYQTVKGTKQEAELRRLMPERFQLLDELTAGR